MPVTPAIVKDSCTCGVVVKPSTFIVVPVWLAPFTNGVPFWNTVVVVEQSKVISSVSANFSNVYIVPDGTVPVSYTHLTLPTTPYV